MTTIAAGAKSKAEPRSRLTLNRLVRVFQRDKYLYLMVLLPLAYFIVFHYIPLYGITLAFKDFDISEGIMGSPWVGFKYFEEFFSNPYSWLVIRNTIVLRLWQLAIGFPAPIILALLLNELRTIRFKRIVQTSSYLPHFISLVVVSGMVISFLASDGPINSLIKEAGRATHSLHAAARVVCPGLHLFRDLAACRLGIGDLPGRADQHQPGADRSGCD